MKPATLSLPLLLLLLLSALPPSFSDSSDDQAFLECSPKNCGTIKNISYPFWVADQQPLGCGFPEFELHCDANTLSLQTSEIKYLVKKIFYANNSILVVPKFDLGTPNSDCPSYYNSSFNLTPFTVSATNMDLFIIYNCTVPQQPLFYKAPCTVHNIFTFLGSNPSELEPFELFQTCEIVEIPVLGFPGANASDYNKLVKNGFLLEWSVADCSDCSSSGGQCGYNVDRKSFMCICNDRTHSRRCNVTRSKVKQIVIGVGVGGGILVMCFICCIWYYRRRIMRQPSSSSKFLIRTGSCNADQEMCSNSYRTHVFSYSELHEATNGFDEARELGDGGFGTVYKGETGDLSNVPQSGYFRWPLQIKLEIYPIHGDVYNFTTQAITPLSFLYPLGEDFERSDLYLPYVHLNHLNFKLL